jgi:hypothetical protein
MGYKQIDGQSVFVTSAGKYRLASGKNQPMEVRMRTRCVKAFEAIKPELRH